MLMIEPRRTITAYGAALPVSAAGETLLALNRLQGGEALSEIYSYTLDFLSAPALTRQSHQVQGFDLKPMIGKALTVAIELENCTASERERVVPAVATREIGGIVTSATFVGTRHRQAAYRLVLQPWLCLATHRSDFRIFQDRSVPEIVSDVLQAYPYAHEMRLGAKYPCLTYQVQYGESDFAFVQRLMQEHGIYWFFEHGEGAHRLVVTDHVGALKPVPHPWYRTLVYDPQRASQHPATVDAFELCEQLTAGHWVTDDFNFQAPAAPLQCRQASPQGTLHDGFERYEWPGLYTEVVQGARKAKVRMEEVAAERRRACADGTMRGAACGSLVEMRGHPLEGANGEYVVVQASIDAEEIGELTDTGTWRFRSRAMLQPTVVPFRPRRTIPKPRTAGPQTATVVGPVGQEIWTDQYGRVKLKFHWDRSPVRDHNASCWVRVAYPWAGNRFGGIGIPRVGAEVIVDFEHGDPDRPLVMGGVYNGLSMPPWTLPENATQSGTLSRSTKGGYSTANAIRFEDRLGEEELWIHAERNHRVEVENDETHVVQGNRRKSIDINETVNVGANRAAQVGGDEMRSIGGNLADLIGGAQSLAVALAASETVGLAKSLAVGQAYDVSVGGAMSRSVANDSTEIVGGAKHSRVEGNVSLDVGQRHGVTVRGTADLDVDQGYTQRIGGSKDTHVSEDNQLAVDGQWTVQVGRDALISCEQGLEIRVGSSSLIMKNDGTIALNGVKVTVDGAEQVRVRSEDIELN